MNETLALVIGIYIGFLLFAERKVHSSMFESCSDCRASGLELLFENDVRDCKTCKGYGWTENKGVKFTLARILLKRSTP